MTLKINVATGLIKRVFQFSPENSFKLKFNKNINKVYEIFLPNGYPKSLVNRLVNKYQHHQATAQPENPLEHKIPHSAIVYIKGLTNRIQQRILKHNDTTPITQSYGLNVRKVFSNLKHKVKTEEKSHLVYRIKCKNCATSYVGLTQKQTLKKRPEQQRGDQTRALWRGICSTALSEHVFRNGHEFDFENVDILQTARNYNKLKIIEALEK